MQPIVTERLVIRPWRSADYGHAAAWHADSWVMQHLGGPMDRETSDDTVRRWCQELETEGFGMLALCCAGSRIPVGAVGLSRPRFESSFTPCVEIGWRLAQRVWGLRFAPEAARAILSDGFGRLGLPEVVAFTTLDNVRSQRVMNRIGMQRVAESNFLRPGPTPADPAVPCALWRVSAR